METILLGATLGTITALAIGAPLIYLTWQNVFEIVRLRKGSDGYTLFEDIINSKMVGKMRGK